MDAQRLLIECSQTLSGGQYTGIQRYVRRTIRHAQEILGPEFARPLVAAGGEWVCLHSLSLHPMECRDAPGRVPPPQSEPLGSNCHVLLADRFWHTADWTALRQLLGSGAAVSVVVYDLLSLRNPEWFPAGVGERFAQYLRLVLPRAGHIVCLSHHVRRDLQAWGGEQRMALAPITVVAPGHRVWDGAAVVPAALPARWRDGSQPFVLQVGTLEPRKNHDLSLAALRRLWARGTEVGALFIGQRGWLTDDLIASMQRLPQWQRQLVWLPECTDAQLQWCYENAAAVLYPSAAEGYGLPLAEAAAAGAPVVAANTAVHREVASTLHPGQHVRLCEPQLEAITQGLSEVLEQGRSGVREAAPRTWADATTELLLVIGASTIRAERGKSPTAAGPHLPARGPSEP